MNTWIALLLLVSPVLFADMNLYRNEEQKISVQNKLLAKVNGNTISLLDVVKKMDVLIHQNYPQFADSPQARFQFYTASWRPVFMEMIDTELMLSDAEDKEVKLTEGEIREEMETKFGPNVLLTLEKIGLSHDDAWNMIKKEMIVRRMMWFFVHSKALQAVTPQAIRQAYKAYLEENPARQEWKYRVVTLRSQEKGEEAVQELAGVCREAQKDPEAIAPLFAEWTEKHPGWSLQTSGEYTASSRELSDAHKTVLSALQPRTYSEPIAQVSRADGKTVYRLFYLYDKTDTPAPAFDEVSPRLKTDLTQQLAQQESQAYLQKLRKYYGFDPDTLRESVPDNLQPFSLN